MKELIEFLAKSLVDEPDSVQVTEHEQGNTTRLELRVAQPDLGKVIGRQGRTARALRTVLAAASRGSRRRTMLDIED